MFALELNFQQNSLFQFLYQSPQGQFGSVETYSVSITEILSIALDLGHKGRSTDFRKSYLHHNIRSQPATRLQVSIFHSRYQREIIYLKETIEDNFVNFEESAEILKRETSQKCFWALTFWFLNSHISNTKDFTLSLHVSMTVSKM